jgi:hypothetical protein
MLHKRAISVKLTPYQSLWWVPERAVINYSKSGINATLKHIKIIGVLDYQALGAMLNYADVLPWRSFGTIELFLTTTSLL